MSAICSAPCHRRVVAHPEYGKPCPSDCHLAVYDALLQRFRALRDDREQVAPSDPYSDHTPPLTDEQVAALESVARQMSALTDYPLDGRTYTCTDCAARHVCAMAFDSYNTDGDCIQEK